MTKPEFDNWFSSNYTRLERLLSTTYPKSRSTITVDLSDFYIHCIDKVLPELLKPECYLRQFIYNRHYVYFSKQREQPDKKWFKPVNFSDISPRELINIESDETIYDGRPDQARSIVDKLPLDYKILYDYYYIKGLSTRKIGKILGISYTGVAFQLKDLRRRVRLKLLESSEDS